MAAAVAVDDGEETAVETMVRVTALVRVEVMVEVVETVSAETMVAAVAITVRRMFEICILMVLLCCGVVYIYVNVTGETRQANSRVVWLSCESVGMVELCVVYYVLSVYVCNKE